MRPWSSQHHSSWVWWMWRKASVTWVAHVFLKRKVLGGLSVLWLPGNQVDHPATSTCCNHVGYRLWDVVRYIVYIIRLLRSGLISPVKHGSPSGISRRIVSWSLREMMQGMFDQVRWVAGLVSVCNAGEWRKSCMVYSQTAYYLQPLTTYGVFPLLYLRSDVTSCFVMCCPSKCMCA